ncbi:MAG: ABC transporter ATP-binding protein, partial [Malacoplasma sp.]
FLVSAIILLVAIWLIIIKAIPYFKKQQKEIDKTNTIMRENLLGVRVVKAFNMQNDQGEKFISQNNILKDTSTKSQRLMILIIPIILFLVQSSTIAVMMISGAHPEFANKDIGIIIGFTQIISLIVIGLVSMVVVLMNISSAKASSDRVNEVLDFVPTVMKNESENVIAKPTIEFKNVFFSYFKLGDVEEASIKDISFKVNSGETIGIIGQTGSGKSTLVNLIARMYDVSKGEILISGINVKDINNISLRENISISPQKTTLFSGTIEDNIKFGNENATFDEIKKSCIDAQAWDFIEKKDGGLKAAVEQRGTNFSGGQKQRLSIARALVKNPKILILDDSTSALDLITEANVQKALRKYTGTTVFIIGQRISSISRADKIIVMNNGEMVAFDTHKKLLSSCQIYKDIAKSQEMVK